MDNVRIIVNILLFGGLSVLNYFLVPTIQGGISFLLGGWFVLLFVGVAVLGGLGVAIGSLFVSSKIKIVYILLGLGISGINTYWLIQILNVIR